MFISYSEVKDNLGKKKEGIKHVNEVVKAALCSSVEDILTRGVKIFIDWFFYAWTN